MSNDTHSVKTDGHTDFERRDIGIAGVVYFMVGLAVAAILIHFIIAGLYKYLENRSEAQQKAVSPLLTNPVRDTRTLPPQFKTDSEGSDYEKYLQKSFPTPQLEIDERTQLNKVRLYEENTLSTYDYVDKDAGSVRIPIERAMDLLVQRGLPTRAQAGESPVATAKGTTKEAEKK
ncbi:MAG TPA: hypothetical protein VMG82_25910 [Candidatus Sulfotelmatobacter sp.]|nr:hypothetical protein [Candidatus Sulfotelmatobacter sp.]